MHCTLSHIQTYIVSRIIYIPNYTNNKLNRHQASCNFGGTAERIYIEPEIKCVAKNTKSIDDLCAASRWACSEEQNYADVDVQCDDDWKKCCQDMECSDNKDLVLKVVTDVYEEYDSQVYY